jgi:hypothetical protein
MKVRALRLGFYGKKRIYEGEVFNIDENHFSKRWMEKFVVGEDKPVKSAPARTSDKDKAVI